MKVTIKAGLYVGILEDVHLPDGDATRYHIFAAIDEDAAYTYALDVFGDIPDCEYCGLTHEVSVVPIGDFDVADFDRKGTPVRVDQYNKLV